MYMPKPLLARRRLLAIVVVCAALAAVSFLSDHRTVAQIGTATAVVGIAKTPTTSPTAAEIDAAVREAIALAGGLPTKIGPGKKIVIQPNLVNAGFASGSGVVPNAQVVKTVIAMCREMGAGVDNVGDIMVIEGAAGFYGSQGTYTSRQMTRKAFKDSGLDPDGDMWVEDNGGTHIAKCVDANYVGDYWGPGNISGAYPNYPQYSGPYDSNYVGTYTKATVPGLFINRVYALPNDVINCDVLIRVPVLKNHNLAGITGALKLAFGFAPSDIYHYENITLYKWRLLHYPDYWGYPEENANAKGMCDMTYLRPPDFVVLDGLAGVTNGPVGGSNGGGGTPVYPTEGKMCCIIAGRDPVAVDTIQTLACNYSVGSIYGLQRAAEMGLGTNDPGKIEVRGVHVKDIRRTFPLWGCAQRGEDPLTDPVLGGLTLPDGVHVCGFVSVSPTGYSDVGSGVCKGELYIDGALVDSSDSTVGTPYRTTWDASAAAPGAHTLTYVLYDRMLNEASLSRTVYVEAGDPLTGALGLPDGTVASVGPVTFAGYAPGIDANTFFVSSPDGLRGLRVRYATTAPSFVLGQQVAVYGTLTTVGGQRVLDCVSYSALGLGAPIRPRMFSNFALGGTDRNGHTPGVPGGAGPNNLGCLVKTTGRVSAGGSDYFYVSDASLTEANAGVTRLKVKCGSIPQPGPGVYVSVVGFSCSENGSGTVTRMLALRSAADILPH